VQIYFDESGDFNPLRASAYNFSFVVGVILPDRALPRLKADFDWFVTQLSRHEFDQRESKGLSFPSAIAERFSRSGRPTAM